MLTARQKGEQNVITPKMYKWFDEQASRELITITMKGLVSFEITLANIFLILPILFAISIVVF